MAVGRRIAATARSEGGFSLMELLVVLSIMGVVLAGAYSLSMVMNKAADVSETQAAFANQVGTSLALAEVYLQQNTALEEWGDNRIVFFVDRDLDGLVERVIIEADADGVLRLTVWNTDMQRDNTDKRIDFLMSENSVNVANGAPLVTYLNDASVEITSTDARASDTRSVIINVEIDVNGYSLDDERTILFRNRS